MTTGTVGNPTNQFDTSSNSPNKLLFRRTWQGGDGKSEVYAGKVRDKWNNYTCTIDSRRIRQTSWKGVRQNGSTFTVSSVTIPGRLPVTATLSANEQNRLLDGLLATVKGHQFNLPVNLGQMGQVTDMVVGNLNSLGRSFSRLRRGDFFGAVQALGASPGKKRGFNHRDTSGRWLELQYGWKPLLSDTFEAAKAFEELTSGPRSSRFVKTRTGKISHSFGVTSNGISGELRGTVGRRLELELYEQMSVPRQLGLTDPASLVWELLPYSFVVDWFIPIGTYLSNLNQIPALNGRWLVTNFVKWPHQRIRWKDHPDSSFGGGYKFGTLYPDVEYFTFGMSRTLGAPPVMRPRFDLRGAIHGVRVWNAIALATQRFLR